MFRECRRARRASLHHVTVRWLVTAMVAICAVRAGADPDGFSVAAGVGSNHTRIGRLALQVDGPRLVQRNDFDVETYWEVSGLSIDARHLTPGPYDDAEDRLHGVAVTPVLRVAMHRWTTSGIAPYLELGVGLGLFDDDTVRAGDWDSKRLGTRWQIESRLVVGAALGRERRFTIGYRRMHFSNADVGRFNEGLNVDLLTFGWWFDG